MDGEPILAITSTFPEAISNIDDIWCTDTFITSPSMAPSNTITVFYPISILTPKCASN